jgi:hypothetical protein
MNLEYFVKDWYDIAWRSCYTTVAQMQQDIVVAYKTGNLKKVAELQYTLVKKFGGSDPPSNLVVLHRECHRQVTFTKNSDLKARFVQQGVISKEPEEK